jgi:DNA repair protein RadC
MLGDSANEKFYVFLLNSKNKVMGYVEAGVGGPNRCPVDRSQVFRAAVMAGATSLIVAHNHPSNDLSPSQDDIALTEVLVAAGKLLEICVLDHIIVTVGNHFSFAEANILPK